MTSGNDLDFPEKETIPSPWIGEAARSPIAFSQVREDAALDQGVVERLGAGTQVLMVASGGCTAALLATRPQISRLHLVDPNPAQMALTRLKLRLLAAASTAERLALLGHAAMPEAERRQRLAVELDRLHLPEDALGPVQMVAESGPDHAGRYEILFAKLRAALRAEADELTALLHLHEPAEQARRADPATPLGRALDAAFESVMALPNLVGLFGEAATRNRCESFARHFARRTRHVLATLPAAENPYLWQMLQGRFPDAVVYPWLTARPPARLPEVVWTVTSMADVLQNHRQNFDYVHLSNILDWLDPEEARSTLALARQALRPGGWILVRQLNSLLDIQALGEGFEWENRAAGEMHHRDRSFFYRRLHLGKRR